MTRFVEGVEGRVEGVVEGETRAAAGLLRVLRVMRTYVCANRCAVALVSNFFSRTGNTLNTLNTFNIKKIFMKKQMVMVKKMLRVGTNNPQHLQHLKNGE